MLFSISLILNKMKENKHIPLIIGGDHSITFPIIKALNKNDLTIIHFDAHPDLYQNFNDNYNSHASPFARICENKLCNKLISIGIRTLNSHQNEQVINYKDIIQIIYASDCPYTYNDTYELLKNFISNNDNIYISIDMDVLDPAFAPGVSHREPGGLSTRQLLNFIHNCPGNIIGMDLVEYNPKKDFDNITASVGAKLIKEMIGKIIYNNNLTLLK